VDTRLLESEPAPVAGVGVPEIQIETRPQIQPESGQAVLADLIAAGLVSHEMIGDPTRLGGETAALRLLCALVAGPVWRIEPYHYAFRADPPGDAGVRAAAIEAALAAELGSEAVWVSATERPETTDLDQPLLLLRAQGEAVLEAAGPETMAVIGAGFAARAARIAVGMATGEALADRLAGLEAGQAALLAAIEARGGAEQWAEQRAEALVAALGQVLQRLDAQADVLHAHIAREDMVAGRLAELATLAGTPAAFTETLGLALAEFLARIETGALASPVRGTQAG